MTENCSNQQLRIYQSPGSSKRTSFVLPLSQIQTWMFLWLHKRWQKFDSRIRVFTDNFDPTGLRDSTWPYALPRDSSFPTASLIFNWRLESVTYYMAARQWYNRTTSIHESVPSLLPIRDLKRGPLIIVGEGTARWYRTTLALLTADNAEAEYLARMPGSRVNIHWPS